MSTGFDPFILRAELNEAIRASGYQQPTPIQQEVIPALLAGEDVIGQAQTGTGKTAAFALPILQHLKAGADHVQCLVMAPTRELAQQVAQVFTTFGAAVGVRVLTINGGASYAVQKSSLKRGVDVVVGTPGRLLDLLRQKVLFLDQLSTLVMDEADEMLSMGFIEDIEAILSETPAARQTALFSATMPPEIRRLANKYMRDPRHISIEKAQRTVSTIDERYYLVNAVDKIAALTRLFEVEDITRALIFTRTRISSGDLASALSARGFPAEALNGDLSQENRERVVERFRTGKLTVLVATDVAARGLDIEGISHVFNYDLPEEIEVYVHRVGRTGRAGRTGIALTLVTPGEMFRLRRLENYTRRKLTRCTIPTDQEIIAHREKRLIEKMGMWLRRDRARREKEMIADLEEQGFDIYSIAAAALKLARGEEKQRPIYPVGEVVELPERARREIPVERGSARGRGIAARDRKQGSRERFSGQPGNSDQRHSHEAGMVRLVLSRGKNDGLRPQDVVGSIAGHAGIPGSTIGRIIIGLDQTMVDIPAHYVNQVLALTDSLHLKNIPVSIQIAEPA